MALTTTEFSMMLKEPAILGRQMIFPINLRSKEERAWKDAVAWLEPREAAREEWPWPGR